MNFNLVSKNNIGVATTLLLVVLLSQSKIFNFLLDNALGRTILIALILIISYINKILGVVSVLFIIIIFNQSDIAYLEGFSGASNLEKFDPSLNNTSPTTNVNLPGQVAQTVVENKTATVPNNLATPARPAVPVTATVPPGGIEGFDLIGTENNIKRGKQSNSIPVSDHMRESSNVLPSEGVFTESFSIY